MHRIPKELDLSAAVGKTTTQVRVGQFDLQFTLGDVDFMVEASASVFRCGQRVAHWEQGRWPDPGFYEIMNTKVTRCYVVDERRIVLEFAHGVELRLEVDSDHESIHIGFQDPPALWVF